MKSGVRFSHFMEFMEEKKRKRSGRSLGFLPSLPLRVSEDGNSLDRDLCTPTSLQCVCQPESENDLFGSSRLSCLPCAQ